MGRSFRNRQIKTETISNKIIGIIYKKEHGEHRQQMRRS